MANSKEVCDNSLFYLILKSCIHYNTFRDYNVYMLFQKIINHHFCIEVILSLKIDFLDNTLFVTQDFKGVLVA